MDHHTPEWSLLQQLWTKSTGNTDYNKREWQRLETMILALGRQVKATKKTANENYANGLSMIKVCEAMEGRVERLTKALAKVVEVTGTSTEANMIARKALAAEQDTGDREDTETFLEDVVGERRGDE